MVTEARIRNQHRHTSFQDYLKLRSYTIGSIATYALCEYGLDLPEEVLNAASVVLAFNINPATDAQGRKILPNPNDLLDEGLAV